VRLSATWDGDDPSLAKTSKAELRIRTVRCRLRLSVLIGASAFAFAREKSGGYLIVDRVANFGNLFLSPSKTPSG